VTLRTSLAPFRKPRLRRLLLAQLTADIGDGIVTVALPLYVYELTGSASATSAAFLVEVLIGMVFALIGGVLADRRDRHNNLVASSIVRALLLIALVLAPYVWLAIACGIATRAMGLLDNPSFDALIPSMADGDLQQVVGARRLTQAASIFIGPAVGGLAVSLISARTTLGFSSVLYVLGLLQLLTLAGIDKSVDERRAEHAGQARAEVLSSIFDGLRVVRDTPYARRLLAYWAMSMATVSIVLVEAIVWFAKDLKVSDSWYGFSIAAYGIGSVLGLAWAGGRTFELSLPAILVRAIPVYVATIVIAVAWHAPWLMGVSWFLWGVALGPELVVGETELIRLIPEVSRGRVSAAQAIITQFGLAVGFAVAGPMVDRLGARTTNTVVAIVTLTFIGFWIRPLRRERAAAFVSEVTGATAGPQTGTSDFRTR
jgi:MFS family permease